MELIPRIRNLLGRKGELTYSNAVLNGLQRRPMYHGLPTLENDRRRKMKQIAKRRNRNKAARRTRRAQRLSA